MFKLSSVLTSFLKFLGYLHPRLDVADDESPAMIDVYMLVVEGRAASKVRGDMDIALSRADPCAPIFEVEVIDLQGHARLFPVLRLHEAIKISADFEGDAQPGREPRVYIRPEHFSVGLADN
jgi:hypothetical protein